MIVVNNKLVLFSIVVVVLLGTAIVGFSAKTYTVSLSPYYSAAYFYMASGTKVEGHTVMANEDISLSSTPPMTLKSYPKITNALYGTFRLAGKNVYILVGNENGSPKVYVSKVGATSVFAVDEVRLGLKRVEKTNIVSYETIVNIHVNYKGAEYTYPIILHFKMKNGKIFPTMYYWIASFMEGKLKLNGKEHHVILGNLNGNGSYEDKSGDILSLDNLSFGHSQNVFFPAMSLVIDGFKYDVVSISPSGTRMVIEATNKKINVGKIPTVGEEFPNFKITFSDGSTKSLSEFKDDIVLLYVWRIPSIFNLQGPDLKINDVMTKTISDLYKKYKSKGLKVIVLPIPSENEMNPWNNWNDQAIQEMMLYNNLEFSVMSVKEPRRMLNQLMLDYQASHIYVLGKNNVLLLSTPSLVMNIFQSFSYSSFSPEQISRFVSSLF